MKTFSLKNWNLMRLLRLVIGLWALAVSIQTKEIVLGVAGGILLIMAFLNIGCFGVSGCAPRANRTPVQRKEDVSYEEIAKK